MKKLKNTMITLLSIATVILLTGCSGGGDEIEEPPIEEKNLPAKAVGVLPANGEPCSDYEEVVNDDSKVLVAFQWNTAQFAQSYVLIVSEGGNEVFRDSFTVLQAQVELDKGKTYTWHLISVNEDGQTNSDTYSFTTPGTPIGNYAPYAAEISVTFDPTSMYVSWIGNDQDGDELTFDIKIFEDGELVSEFSDVLDSQINPMAYAPNAEYTVNVNSKDSHGSSSESNLTVIAPNDQNSVESFAITIEGEVLIGFVDEVTSTILVEYSEEADLENLPVEIKVSEKATLDPNLGGTINLSNGFFLFTVIAENGAEREHRIAGYTKNLLKNPSGNNDGEFWTFNGNVGDTGVDEMVIGRNEFYIIKHDDGSLTNIRQNIELNRDYGGKYILFLGDLTTEKVVDGSITRRPYFWGHQNGPFNFDSDPIEEVIQGDMMHWEEANVWEIVYDANPLLEGVESVLFQMGQGHRAGDPPDGTKCKFRDVEVRIFESSEDAEIYVSNLYLKQ